MSSAASIIVLVLAIACMIYAQRKSLPRRERTGYALIGSAASVIVAVQAAQESQVTTVIIFSVAALMSLLGIIMDYLKPTNSND